MADPSRKGDILKVRLGDDLRRMVLYNTHISYDDLVLMLQRVYGGKLKSTDDVTLKYYDEDDDLITIADDSDFAHAREFAPRGVVKLVVYVNGQDRYVDARQLLGIRKELAEVRDKVNSLVDALDAAKVADNTSSASAANDVVGEGGDSSRWTRKGDEPKILPHATSMFDPLTTISNQVSTVTTTLSTVTGTVSSTYSVDTSAVAGQTEGGAAHYFASGQDGAGSSLFPQTSSQAGTLSQGQSGAYNSQPQASTTASAPPPSSSSPQPPASSSSVSGGNYPAAAQTGQPSYLSTQPQPAAAHQQQPYPSSYSAQPSAPSAGTTVTNPSYPLSSAPNPGQYPAASAPNPTGYGQGAYPQAMPPGTTPYPGSYGGGSNVSTYPPQSSSPYSQQPAPSARFTPQPYGRPYKIGY